MQVFVRARVHAMQCVCVCQSCKLLQGLVSLPLESWWCVNPVTVSNVSEGHVLIREWSGRGQAAWWSFADLSSQVAKSFAHCRCSPYLMGWLLKLLQILLERRLETKIKLWKLWYVSWQRDNFHLWEVKLRCRQMSLHVWTRSTESYWVLNHCVSHCCQQFCHLPVVKSICLQATERFTWSGIPSKIRQRSFLVWPPQ